MKTIRAAGEYEGEIYAQVFEDDLEFIKLGQKAIVEVPAYHQKYEGAVNSIDSRLMRPPGPSVCVFGLKAIIEKHLKTNMFVNVEFPVNLGTAIIVPRDAVMDTGMRKIVFVREE